MQADRSQGVALRNCRRQRLHCTALHKQLNTKKQDGPPRPEDATLECLTVLRKGDLSLLRPWLSDDSIEECTSKTLIVGGYAVDEASPFVGCTQVMDAAARRVLPGHLLRRCQVLSSIQIGPSCIQRVLITACSGEECIFRWVMSQLKDGSWRVDSIHRDTLQDEDPETLPSRPHPRVSPEAVIRAQLAALQQGDVAGASRYNLWGRATSGGSEVHQEGFRALLRQRPYQQLLTHHSYHLLEAALPTPHHFVQEVEVMQPPSRAGPQVSCRLVWDLRLQGNGCWATCGIRPAAH